MAAGVAHEQLSDQVRSPVLTVNSSDNKTNEKPASPLRVAMVWLAGFTGRCVGRSRLALTTAIWHNDRTGHRYHFGDGRSRRRCTSNIDLDVWAGDAKSKFPGGADHMGRHGQRRKSNVSDAACMLYADLETPLQTYRSGRGVSLCGRYRSRDFNDAVRELSTRRRPAIDLSPAAHQRPQFGRSGSPHRRNAAV